MPRFEFKLDVVVFVNLHWAISSCFLLKPSPLENTFQFSQMWTSTWWLDDFALTYHFFIPTLSLHFHFFIPTLSISSWEYVPINFINSKAAFLDLQNMRSARTLIDKQTQNQKTFLKEIASKNNLKTKPSLDKNSLSFLGPISRYFQPVGIICVTSCVVRNESRINKATQNVSGQPDANNI